MNIFIVFLVNNHILKLFILEVKYIKRIPNNPIGKKQKKAFFRTMKCSKHKLTIERNQIVQKLNKFSHKKPQKKKQTTNPIIHHRDHSVYVDSL